MRSFPNLGILRSVRGVLVVAGIGLWLLEALQSRRDTTPSSGLLVSLWALAPLLLIRHVRPLHPHYYVVAMLPLCLAAGLVLDRAPTARLRTMRAGAMILVIILGAHRHSLPCPSSALSAHKPCRVGSEYRSSRNIGRLTAPAQVPPDPPWMRVGMCTYPEMQNQPVLDASGQSGGDFVTLGPLPSK